MFGWLIFKTSFNFSYFGRHRVLQWGDPMHRAGAVLVSSLVLARLEDLVQCNKEQVFRLKLVNFNHSQKAQVEIQYTQVDSDISVCSSFGDRMTYLRIVHFCRSNGQSIMPSGFAWWQAGTLTLGLSTYRVLKQICHDLPITCQWKHICFVGNLWSDSCQSGLIQDVSKRGKADVWMHVNKTTIYCSHTHTHTHIWIYVHICIYIQCCTYSNFYLFIFGKPLPFPNMFDLLDLFKCWTGQRMFTRPIGRWRFQQLLFGRGSASKWRPNAPGPNVPEALRDRSVNGTLRQGPHWKQIDRMG